MKPTRTNKKYNFGVPLAQGANSVPIGLKVRLWFSRLLVGY